MSQFSHYIIKKRYFKQSFNNISGNRGSLFSQINFDQTYFGRVLSRGFWHGRFCPWDFCLGVYVQGFCLGGGLCPKTVFNTSLCARRYGHTSFMATPLWLWPLGRAHWVWPGGSSGRPIDSHCSEQEQLRMDVCHNAYMLLHAGGRFGTSVTRLWGSSLSRSTQPSILQVGT